MGWKWWEFGVTPKEVSIIQESEVDIIEPPTSWKIDILTGQYVNIVREYCNHYRSLEGLSIKPKGEAWTGPTFSSWLYDMVKKYESHLL
jgi:hypothetical protein